VKKYVEERELTSSSPWTSAARRTSAPAGARKGAGGGGRGLLAFSAIRNNDRVGAILFTGHVEK